MFLLPKNNKVVRKQVKLNYDLTYEEAFPDKEFRRMILTMLYDIKPNNYDGTNYGPFYSSFSSILKYTGDANSSDIPKNTFPDSKLDEYSKQKIDKSFLDSIKIVQTNDSQYKNISSLKGIEYLTNLKVLALSGTKIKEADFSNNLELETLFLPEKFYSSFGSANITGSSLLEKVNIKNNSKLKNLVLNLNPNKENTVDLSGNPNLQALYLEQSNLKEIDLTNNPNLQDWQINLKNNKLKEIKANNPNQYAVFGASEQKKKLNVDKGVPIKIPLKVNNQDKYLFDDSSFTRNNDVYTFNKVGTHTYNFFDKITGYGGTVEVTVTGGEAKKYKPIVNANNKVYVGQNFTYSNIIANYPPKTAIDQELDNSSKGLKTVKFTSYFDDGSQGSYEVQIPVFEKSLKAIDVFKATKPKSEYMEGNLSKTLVLSYSDISYREEYLNTLKKKNKCNYENFTCEELYYNIPPYWSVGSIPNIPDIPSLSQVNPGKYHEFEGINSKTILDTKVKVYNSKQMEKVVKNYPNGNELIDWKANEEEKKYYVYPGWAAGTEKILETTILRDTDGDGIPDKEDDDDDNDGISDAQELVDGTNPKDKNDFKVKKICYKVNA